MHPQYQRIRKQLPGIIRRQKLKKIMPSFAPATDSGKRLLKGAPEPAMSVSEDRVPTINWAKIFENFHPKLFSKSFDRHQAIFERLCMIHGSGVPLHDLANVADFLMVVNVRITEQVEKPDGETTIDRLRTPLCKYLTVLRRPFGNLTGGKGIEELTEDLKQFTRVVGSLVDIEDHMITGCVVEILFKLAGGPKIESPISTHRIVTYPWLLDSVSLPPSLSNSAPEQYTPRDTQMELLGILRDSEVIENLTKALQHCSASNAFNLPYHNDILRALRRLSICDSCIAQMVSDQTFIFIVESLRQSPNASIDLPVTIEILWNALESPHRQQVAEALSSNAAIGTFAQHLTITHPPDLLTDLLIVCNDICRLNPDKTTWTNEGVLDQIWKLLTRPHPTGTVAHADAMDSYVLQKELLVFLERFCADGGEILRWCLKKGLLEFLLPYLSFESSDPSIACWSMRQLKGLQLQILSVLQKILPNTPFPLHTHPTLHRTLLSFLQQALEQDKPSPPSGDDGHPNPVSDYVGLVASVLRTIETISEREVESCLLVGLGDGFHVLIGILKNEPPLPSPTPLTTLTLLTTLLSPRKNRQTFASIPSSIPTLLSHLSTEPLAALSSLWATLPTSTDAVLLNNGVQRVLDVLVNEKEWGILSVGLGFLCDLVESRGVANVMKEWRDKADSGVVKWLITLWKGVELSLGVPQGPHGSISLDGDDQGGLCRNPLTCDTVIKPLAHQRHVPEIQDDFTEDIEEMGWNLRAKIYSLIHHLHPVDTSVLTPEEEIKLILIDSYPTFKHHILLRTLAHSLYKANIRPTQPDQEVLDMAETVLLEKKRYVNSEQMKVIERHLAKQKEDEEGFWKEVQWVVGLREPKTKRTLPPMPKTPEGLCRKRSVWREATESPMLAHHALYE
ncbi:hypothetical protein DFJ77DRAFT_365584 [Powellomyces hirtus]|nr:hypothetical protein DFJ77DRAFT_365584 [Powellomyces hirtus]